MMKFSSKPEMVPEFIAKGHKVIKAARIEGISLLATSFMQNPFHWG